MKLFQRVIVIFLVLWLVGQIGDMVTLILLPHTASFLLVMLRFGFMALIILSAGALSLISVVQVIFISKQKFFYFPILWLGLVLYWFGFGISWNGVLYKNQIWLVSFYQWFQYFPWRILAPLFYLISGIYVFKQYQKQLRMASNSEESQGLKTHTYLWIVDAIILWSILFNWAPLLFGFYPRNIFTSPLFVTALIVGFITMLVSIQGFRWFRVILCLAFGLVVFGSFFDRMILHGGFQEVSYCEDIDIYRFSQFGYNIEYTFYRESEIPGFYIFVASSRDQHYSLMGSSETEYEDCLIQSLKYSVEDHDLEELKELDSTSIKNYAIEVPSSWSRRQVNKFAGTLSFQLPQNIFFRDSIHNDYSDMLFRVDYIEPPTRS